MTCFVVMVVYESWYNSADKVLTGSWHHATRISRYSKWRSCPGDLLLSTSFGTSWSRWGPRLWKCSAQWLGRSRCMTTRDVSSFAYADELPIPAAADSIR